VGSVTSDQVAPVVAGVAVVVVAFAGLDRRGRVVVERPCAGDVVGVEVVDGREGAGAVVLGLAHDVVTRATPIAIAHLWARKRCV